MMNVRIEFDKLDGITPDEMRKGKINTGYYHINVHMLFDINMYLLENKYCWITAT